MEEIRTNSFDAKDMFNAAMAIPLKNLIGKTINVVGLWVTERPDFNGVVQTVANIKTEDGLIYGTISETVIRSLVALPEMLESADEIAVKVEERPGKQGRNYLVLTLA